MYPYALKSEAFPRYSQDGELLEMEKFEYLESEMNRNSPEYIRWVQESLNKRGLPSVNPTIIARTARTPILARPSESELAKEISRNVTILKPIYAPINVTFGRYNGKVYFFHQDGTYSRFDRKTCQLEYYAPITYWNGWPTGWQRPDTAVSWDTQHVYFFRGSEYLRYDMEADRVDYTASIQKYWRGWPSHWDRVDAALYWDCLFEDYSAIKNPCPPNTIPWRRKVYFFRGDEYLRYDLENDAVDEGYPLNIKHYWVGWPLHWAKVHGAFDWGNGKIYFFSDREYLRYDKFFDKVDDGYPRPLIAFFKEHEEKLNEESQSLIFENQVPVPQRQKFIAAVRCIARQLDIRPNWLMVSIWFESGFNPHAGEDKGKYVGLHQMSLPLIYSYWGRTASVLRNSYPQLFWGQDFKQLEPQAIKMLIKEFGNVGFDQIYPVSNWLKGALASQQVKCCSFDQLRLIGFGGYGFGNVDRTLLAKVVLSGNPCYDLNKDNKIDLGEFRTAVFYLIHYKFRNNAAVGEKIRHQLG